MLVDGQGRIGRSRNLRKETSFVRKVPLPEMSLMSDARRLFVRLPILLLLPLLLSATACGQSSTAEEEPDLAPLSIDGEKLLQHVEVLASDAYQGRKAGTAGGQMALSYVESAFNDLGVSPACGTMFQQPFSYEGRTGQVNAVNLLARIPGTSDQGGSIVLTAHFDHLGVFNDDIYNGADDNASGVAGLLEIARAVLASPLEHDLILAAVDAEESGLRGARHFVDSECFPGLDVRLNVNLDMISRNEAGELYASGTYHYPFLKPILESVGHRDNMTLLFGHDEPGSTLMDWSNASDHAPFHGAGIPFVYFGVEDHAGYHNPTDDFEAITPEFFQSAADYVYNAIRALDAAVPDFPAPSGN